MKKAFRDIKRGVNKKVLKVPSIEQKVLDATSNESPGPHGTHLADIAQASRNYHEHQIIMSVVWKRLSDTGKNWRHVYKALTVLEYLVANGSERVIEDIREHGYQISNLASFQYIDSTGRDQGSNIRKKSQSLVALVNDKEKIQEAREKAAADRDKFRHAPGDDRYEGQYGSRDEDHNGYGEDHNGRYGYGEDEYYRKSQSIDGDYGAKSQSSDRDDGHHSSRGSNARVEDGSPDVSRLEPKLPGQNDGAPPSYEDGVTEGETPPSAANHQETVLSSNSAPSSATIQPPAATTPPLAATATSVISDKETDGFDFFDPRAAPPAALSAARSAEVDLFGSLSDSFSSDVLALVPSEPLAPTGPSPSPSPSQTFVAASPMSQQFDDPFGDGPFRAVPSTDVFSAQQSSTPFGEPPQTVAQMTMNDMGFGDSFDQTVDILAGILPPTGPPSLPAQTVIRPLPDQHSAQSIFSSQTGQPDQTAFPSSFPGPFGPPVSQPSYPGPFGPPVSQPSYPGPFGPPVSQPSYLGPFGQPTPQPAFPVQGAIPPSSFPSQSSQPMSPPSFLAAQGGQSVSRPGFSVAKGDQFDLPPGFPAQSSQSALSPGFPAAQVGQSELVSGFPTQGSQSMSSPSFPVAQGGQSELPSGFPAQNGQSASSSGFPAAQGLQPELVSGFPTQDSQSMLPPSFTAAQGGQSELPSGFPAQNSQSVSSSGFPATQGGQSVFSSGFPVAQDGGQSVLPPGYPAAQTGQSVPSPGFPAAQGVQSVLPSGFPAAQAGHSVLPPGFPSAHGGQSAAPSGFSAVQGSQSLPPPSFPAAQGSQSEVLSGHPAQGGQSVLPLVFTSSQNGSLGGISSQSGTVSQAGFSTSNGQTSQHNNNLYGGFQSQGQPTPAPTTSAISVSSFYQQQPLQSNTSMIPQPPSVTATTGALAIVPQQPLKEKFETKSTVWADTLNRGLVNLNISGSKTNPLSDIGIDFEAINRKEKRMEKPSKTPVTSNVAMGKAMGSGSGSGIGRAGAGALRPAPNPMMGSGMGMGAPGAGPGFGAGYGSMGMNNMHQNMGMGMNGQGFQMQPPPATGFMPPGSYNPMMGRGGGYGQQPYGGY